MTHTVAGFVGAAYAALGWAYGKSGPKKHLSTRIALLVLWPVFWLSYNVAFTIGLWRAWKASAKHGGQ